MLSISYAIWHCLWDDIGRNNWPFGVVTNVLLHLVIVNWETSRLDGTLSLTNCYYLHHHVCTPMRCMYTDCQLCSSTRSRQVDLLECSVLTPKRIMFMVFQKDTKKTNGISLQVFLVNSFAVRSRPVAFKLKSFSCYFPPPLPLSFTELNSTPCR